MQIISDGVELIELVPGAILHASAVTEGSYAVLTLHSKTGVATFAGASTGASGTAAAGPFATPVTIKVEVRGKVSVYATPPLNLGSYGLEGVTYNGAGKTTGYKLDGVTYTVTGWGTSEVVVSGDDGSTRKIAFNGAGQITGVS